MLQGARARLCLLGGMAPRRMAGVCEGPEAQQARGRVEPEFDPRPLGIKNAELWEKIADKRKRQA